MTRSEDDLRAVYRQPPDPATLARLRASIDELGEPAARIRPNRSRWLAPVLAAVVLIAVFASIAVYGFGNRGTGSGGALELWADFPVNASPRPLVLTGPAILDPREGFPTGDAKLAYTDGEFDLKTTLPTGPSTVDGQPVDTAAQALAELRSLGDSKHPERSPLQITEVTFGNGTFSTDRGTRSLPAWIFHFTNVVNPALVLAIPPTDRWPLADMPKNNGSYDSVSISRDGSQITLTFIGAEAGTGPCQAEYTADIKESATAVLISPPRELPHSGRDPGQCDLRGFDRTVTLTLRSPLGNRVVVNSQGVPLAVD
jgi:hypothetical protein